jgi:hypothetical protein
MLVALLFEVKACVDAARKRFSRREVAPLRRVDDELSHLVSKPFPSLAMPIPADRHIEPSPRISA